jgi:hypothetical protein
MRMVSPVRSPDHVSTYMTMVILDVYILAGCEHGRRGARRHYADLDKSWPTIFYLVRPQAASLRLVWWSPC